MQTLKTLYQTQSRASTFPALHPVDLQGTTAPLFTVCLTSDALRSFTSATTASITTTVARKASRLQDLHTEVTESVKEQLNQQIKAAAAMHKEIRQQSESCLAQVQSLHGEVASVRSELRAQQTGVLEGLGVQDLRPAIALLLQQVQDKASATPLQDLRTQLEESLQHLEKKTSQVKGNSHRIQTLKARLDKLTNKKTQITDDSWINVAPASRVPTPQPNPALPRQRVVVPAQPAEESPVESRQSSLPEFEDADIYLP